MPKFRTLSGDDLLRIFYVKLRRVLLAGDRQPLTIVAHKQVDKGTLQAILGRLSATYPNPS